MTTNTLWPVNDKETSYHELNSGQMIATRQTINLSNIE